jgi:hypothetical protein
MGLHRPPGDGEAQAEPVARQTVLPSASTVVPGSVCRTALRTTFSPARRRDRTFKT